MRKRKVAFAAYAVAMASLLIWLFFSNSIIVDLSKKNSFREIIWDDELLHDDVDFYLEGGEIQIGNDLLETFGISGWAFVDTEEDNSDRYASVILKGDDVCYESKFTNYIKRTDARSYASNGKLKSYMVGIANDFSTVNIKDGVYDLYISCRENEMNYGITDTGHSMKYFGIQVEKSGKLLKQYMWRAKQITSVIKISEKDYTLGGIDSFWTDLLETEDGRLNVRGWVSVKNLNCDTQEVYIEVKGQDGSVTQYTTKKVLREDVANKYETENYKKSGYKTSIPIENISNGQYFVKVLLKNENKVWSSKPYMLKKSDDEIVWEQIKEIDI